MIHFLTIGIILGVSAGFAPGPLLTLVISETLAHDVKAGVKVALAPLITDLPIIIITIFILAKLSNFQNILGIISLVGGVVILFMGYESIRSRGVDLNLQKGTPKSVLKGVLANALSPHAYLFWVSVGGPILTKAMNHNLFAPAVFIGSFLFLLVGSKIVIAMIVGKSKTFLRGRVYIYTMRFLGLVLWGLAVVLFHDGLKLLGIFEA